MSHFTGEYFKTLAIGAYDYLAGNYDYCYLDAMHYKNRKQGADKIIVGSSHAMNGVIEGIVGDSVINFSISSQDLYFDYLHIKKAIEEGKKQIQTCIINIGYYMIYQDLSRSRMLGSMIPSVYYPLFQDPHNYKGDLSYDCLEGIRQIENRSLQISVYQDWARGYFMEQGSYYGGNVTRENNNILGVKKVKWSEMTIEEKENYARERASRHNKIRKYTDSFAENIKIISQMTELLAEHQVRCVFLICPFTRYYNKYIDAGFRTEIFEVLDGLKAPVEFYDINEFGDDFTDADFLDSDHLNDVGAEKLSKMLRVL